MIPEAVRREYQLSDAFVSMRPVPYRLTLADPVTGHAVDALEVPGAAEGFFLPRPLDGRKPSDPEALALLEAVAKEYAEALPGAPGRNFTGGDAARLAR